METERVLVAGIPRSGTTWLGKALGATGAGYVHEPDNHLQVPQAWCAKQGLGSYPALDPGTAAPEYERLWEAAFGGGQRTGLRYNSARLMHRAVPRAGRRSLHGAGGSPAAGTLRLAGTLARSAPPQQRSRVVVKSVFCARSIEWLADRFSPSVVVIERHPFAVIASWGVLGWDGFLDEDPSAVLQCAERFGVVAPAPGATWIERAAWHYGFLTRMLRSAAVRHPEWVVVSHETLCADPLAAFPPLARRLGLDWTPAAVDFLLASNRRGKGYSTRRVWSEEVDGWRTRLHPDDQDLVAEILGRFPDEASLDDALSLHRL
ncbi:MAG: hypothetical protein ACRDY7_14985 [Acidimicrobiia bacterium]